MLRTRTFGAMGASLIALVAGSGIAMAADIYQMPPTSSPSAYYAPTSAFSWTGPYLGLQGGYGWGSSTFTDTETPANVNKIGVRGWQGGVYGGYNFQTASPLVIGVEADANWSGKSGSNAGDTVSNPWNASIRGRLGFSMDRYMVYGTGGVAFGSVKVTDNLLPPVTESATRVGWAAGLGVEAAVTENVVVRGEFRHTNLGTATLPTLGTASYYSNDVMVGIGYKF